MPQFRLCTHASRVRELTLLFPLLFRTLPVEEHNSSESTIDQDIPETTAAAVSEDTSAPETPPAKERTLKLKSSDTETEASPAADAVSEGEGEGEDADKDSGHNGGGRRGRGRRQRKREPHVPSENPMSLTDLKN